MQNICILKVESPWCLWGRLCLDSKGQHEDLQMKMNLHYHDVSPNTVTLKPCSLLEGQVCVLYWSMMQCWCRATVESVVLHVPLSTTMQVRCFLVDHGERVVVTSNQIRTLEPEFLRVPFQAQRYSLAGVSPTTLKLSICEEKALLIPSKHWDSSATRYLHNLLQASTQMEALLREETCDHRPIELYLTVQGVKICVNDDLVAKRFAYYCGRVMGRSEGQVEEEEEEEEEEVERSPPMLACDIFSDTDCFLASSGCSIRSYCTLTSPRTSDATQGRGPATGDPWEEETADPTLQRSLERRAESGGAPGGAGPGCPAGGARARTEEDTDASLQASLTTSLNLFRNSKYLNPDAGFQSTSWRDDSTDVDQPSPTLNPPVKPPNPIPNPTGMELAADWLQDDMGKEIQNAPTTAIWGKQKRRDEDEDAQNEFARETVFGPPTHQDSTKTPRAPSSFEDRACSRLLEWLNSEPQLDPMEKLVDSDPCREGVLLHSALPIEPCTSLADAPITHLLHRVLVRRQYPGPSVCERYSWPAVARGCDSVIISPGAEQPLSYLPPLLTHLLLSPPSPSTHSGPIAVILCPGWEKAHTVAELLDDLQANRTLHPLTVLLGVAKDEAKTVKIPKNCLLLVTTPFSLLRLISCHCFLFLRLSNLILDQADLLFSLASEQMSSILQHFQKVTVGEEEGASRPRQILAVSRSWSGHMEDLLTNHMSSPCVVITLPEEAALYGGVHQRILLALESNRVSVLLGGLDFNPCYGQKTLIIANSVEEVEQVFKVVNNTSALCLKAHQESTDLFEATVQQWRKDVGQGMQVIMVTTDVCVRSLGVRDATCVVHYGFPTSRRLFGQRLFSMVRNFRNLLDQHKETGRPPPVPPQSLLLLSERNTHHVVGVLRYLRRTGALLPPELLSFAQGVLEVREQSRTTRPLCALLKSFGVCRSGPSCPDRHRFNPQQDQSLLPATGTLTVLPLYIKTASVFYGRIIGQSDEAFEKLSATMVSFYTQGGASPEELVVGELYALKEDQCYHRARVLSEPQRGDGLFFRVLVCLVDEGREQEVRFHQLRQLPAHFQVLPEQAVEMVLCGVQPTDSEPTWNPEVTRVISQKVRGHQHQAKVVLSLGNTVFLDPMVKVRGLPGLRTVINDHDVRRLVLETGKGTSNPEHLELLKNLCHEGGATDHTDTNQVFGWGSRLSGSLEEQLKAAEEVLVSACRAADSRPYPSQNGTSDCQNPGPEPSEDRLFQQESQGTGLVNGHTDAQLTRMNVLKNSDPGHLPPGENAFSCEINGSGESISRADVPRGLDPTGCDLNLATRVSVQPGEMGGSSPIVLHPQVRWYQTTDCVMMTMKLINPEGQHCDFYPDRVVYSGSVGGRLYRADLGLSGTVAAASCNWTMKCNQPVLLLLKEPPGLWNRLLRHKNPLVSYDLEHWKEEEEEEEDATLRGHCFMADMGEECSYVMEHSDSDSD